MAFTEQLLGLRERISWVDETSYGVGGTMTAGEIVGLNATIAPDFNQNWQEILTSGGNNRLIDRKALGPLTLPFTIEFTPVNWKFLKYCGYSVVDAGSDPYTHTFTLANSIQSFKLEWAKRHTTAHVLTLSGCVVKSCIISFSKSTGEGEGMLKVSLSCVAKAVAQGSSVTSLSSITHEPFQWRHFKFTLGGTERTEVNNGEITIDNGIDEADSRYCNSTLDRALGEPIPKTHRLSGRFNVNIADKTYFDYWNAATPISGSNKIEFIRGNNDELDATFGTFWLAQGVAPTDLEGVTNVDLVWSSKSWTPLVATDSLTPYE